MTLHHATALVRVPTILREGLRPRARGYWGRTADGRIHAFTEANDALLWAGKMEWAIKQPTCIVEFEADGALVDEDRPLDVPRSAVWLLASVAPDAIREVHVLTTYLLRGAIARRNAAINEATETGK